MKKGKRASPSEIEPVKKNRRSGSTSSRVLLSAPRPWMLPAAIFVLGALVYASILSNELVYDDLLLIPNHPGLHDPWNISSVFGGSYWGDIRSGAGYRPFSSWTIALNYWFNERLGMPGAAPFGFHLTNIALHGLAGAAALAFLTALTLPRWAAVFSAALFAVHPIHTEAVAGVIGRAEILAFALGMIMLTLHHRRQAPWWTATAYLLALLSKESALMFFPLAVVMDALFVRRPSRWPFPHYAGYAAAAGLWGGLWLYVHGAAVVPFPFIDNPLVGLSPVYRICTALSIQLDYLTLFLYPVTLSSDYSYRQIPLILSVWNGRAALFLLIAAGMAWAGWRLRASHPGVAFGAAGYAILFGVTGNVIQPIGTIMGERLAYSPSLGWCMLLGYGVWALREKTYPALALGVAGLLLAAGVWLTIDRNATWADERVFYETQIRTAPNSAKAHFNYGTMLAKTGDDKAAVKAYEKAVEIFPFYPEPFYNTGNALNRLNAPPEQVISAYRKAIEYDRGHREAHANLATALLNQGRAEEAKPVVDALMALDPAYPSLEFLKARLNAVQTPAMGGLPVDFQQAVMAYAGGRHAETVRLMQQTLDSGGLSPQIRRTALLILSNACMALGDTVQAKQYRSLGEQIPATQPE